MKSLLELHVRNGCVGESYTIEAGEDGVFIHAVMDADEGGPLDTVHIDHTAVEIIGRTLVRYAARHRCAPATVHANVVAFPVMVP